MAQFERNLISERTKVGLASARKRGCMGGPKPKLTEGDITKARAMLSSGTLAVSDVAKHFDVSRPTLYKYIGEITLHCNGKLFFAKTLPTENFFQTLHTHLKG